MFALVRNLLAAAPAPAPPPSFVRLAEHSDLHDGQAPWEVATLLRADCAVACALRRIGVRHLELPHFLTDDEWWCGGYDSPSPRADVAGWTAAQFEAFACVWHGLYGEANRGDLIDLVPFEGFAGTGTDYTQSPFAGKPMVIRADPRIEVDLLHFTEEGHEWINFAWDGQLLQWITSASPRDLEALLSDLQASRASQEIRDYMAATEFPAVVQERK